MSEQATAPEPPASDAPEALAEQQTVEPFDETRALEKISKANREAANLRKRLQELEPLAAKAKELEDASKSEAERLAEKATAAEKERDKLAAQVARLTAASKHSIPAELVDLLGNGTVEEIDARAQILAERIGAPTPAPSNRPVESLKPGGAPAEQQTADPDNWLRRMAGR